MALDLLVELVRGADFEFEPGMVVAMELLDGDDLDHTRAKAGRKLGSTMDPPRSRVY